MADDCTHRNTNLNITDGATQVIRSTVCSDCQQILETTWTDKPKNDDQEER
jgi:hypothetical protein